ncbi:MAG: hypothetical protein C4576_08670 [Desulfobacteraceae bacterium]|nr:MAG: hypothetical protein C4576_08670 [Desulfobacteraceae bacterium]
MLSLKGKPPRDLLIITQMLRLSGKTLFVYGMGVVITCGEKRRLLKKAPGDYKKDMGPTVEETSAAMVGKASNIGDFTGEAMVGVFTAEVGRDP